MKESAQGPEPVVAAAQPASRLLNRDFVLLWQGQFASQLGNQAFFIAMMVWTMEATGSGSTMGLLLMLSSLPGVFLAPLGGTFADRHSRRAIIVAADLVRGVGVLVLAALVTLRPQATGEILWALFIVAILGGVVGAAFLPAVTAAIPDLVPREKIAAANSLQQVSAQASVLLGQALGGVAYRLLGASTLFLIDGVSYLVSAASEAFIRLPPARGGTEKGLGEVARAYRDDTRAGFFYVWNRPGMRSFLLVAAGVNFFFMPLFVLLPFHVRDGLGAGPEWFGFLLAAMGGGSLAGFGVAGASKATGKARRALVLFALFAAAGVMALLGWVTLPAAALATFFVLGALTGMINIFVLTLFQTSTPTELRGRVMSLVVAISGAVAPLGMGLGGVLGDLMAGRLPVLFTACGVATAALLALAATRQSFRDFLAGPAAG